MSERNDGGPAFARSYMCVESQCIDAGSEGMSLRDYFAAKALPEAIRHHLAVRSSSIAPGEFDFDLVALTAGKMADAMLKERAK